MRARHTAHSTPGFPVYSATFLSPGELILGGGGGTSKTGIKNKLVCCTSSEPLRLRLRLFLFLLQRLYHVDEYLTLKLADELELDKGEDAPMSMAAHPTVRYPCELPTMHRHSNHFLGVLVCVRN